MKQMQIKTSGKIFQKPQVKNASYGKIQDGVNVCK